MSEERFKKDSVKEFMEFVAQELETNEDREDALFNIRMELVLFIDNVYEEGKHEGRESGVAEMMELIFRD